MAAKNNPEYKKFKAQSRQFPRQLPARLASSPPKIVTVAPANSRRELRLLLAVWLAIAVAWLWLGGVTATKLGFNYDEAIFVGMAKDYTTGEVHGRHMPGTYATNLWDRPFPIWLQPYVGALKSWLFIPLFALFEPTPFLVRMTNLTWTLVGLLLFMLWVRKLFGLREALVGALLIATDPAFFYTSLLDWGGFVPSFVCRCAGFFFALLAWRKRKARWFLLAGAVFGLGFFNKVDFVVVLLGVGVAVICAYAKPVWDFICTQPKLMALTALGFLLGSGPMTAISLRMFKFAAANNAPVNPGEFSEKLHTLTAMYDGSYFYRMLAAGGLFDKMQQLAPHVWTPLGLAVIVALPLLAWQALRLPAGSDARRAQIFLLAALLLATLGVFLLPRAVRIYHAILAAPFAHLIVAVAAVSLWRKFSEGGKKFAGTLVVLIFTGLLATQIYDVTKTEQLIFATHGRGWWSDVQERFAATVKDRADLTLVSLDWGFHESLLFLTDKPILVEPFWKLTGTDPAKLPQDTNLVYLAHTPEYSLSPFGATFLEFARKNPRAKISEWRDREGKLVFYTVQFAAP